MKIESIEKLIKENKNSDNSTLRLLACRADYALNNGLKALSESNCLGDCPAEDVDIQAYDNWQSKYAQLGRIMELEDKTLALCLEAFGCEYCDVQSVLFDKWAEDEEQKEIL